MKENKFLFKIKLTKENTSFIQQAFKIYEDSFPFHERRNTESFIRIMSNENYFPYAFHNNKNVSAILFFWKIEDYYFIEHFAVNSESRGEGLGSKILSEFIFEKQKVLLEIDPPKDILSEKRLNFYKKFGFLLNRQTYFHPGFFPNLHKHELKLLSYPSFLGEEKLKSFIKFRNENML